MEEFYPDIEIIDNMIFFSCHELRSFSFDCFGITIPNYRLSFVSKIILN